MRKKGFTLIELMVVILIVAILAAVLAPMMSGRIRSAKWTEGRTGAGTIATALRAYIAEHEGLGNLAVEVPALSDGTGLTVMGIDTADLTGKYFVATDYELTSYNYDPATGLVSYVITVTPAGTWANSQTLTLTTSSLASQNVWDGPK
jgi:type IV pilus assembly protein PilA